MVLHENTIDQNQWLSGKYKPKLVSVIIPAYNAARFISDALKSVFLQTYRPIEIIIVDDGSKDETKTMVLNMGKQFEDDTQFAIHYILQKNKGGAAARNAGLLQSRGEYIQFLDADDLLSTDKLTAQIALLENSADQTAVYGPWRHFDNVKNQLKIYQPYYNSEEKDLLKSWIQGWFVPSHSFLWKRKDIQLNGPWDENLAADQDGEYAMRFLANSGKLMYCKNAWIYYRKNPTFGQLGASVSRQVSTKAIRSRIIVVRRLEKLFEQRRVLNTEYRKALSYRYYNIAKNCTTGNKVMRKLCLRNFKRLSSDGKFSGTIRHNVLTRFVGFTLTQKLRLFFRGVLGVQTYSPTAEVKSIDELCRYDN